jgi:hypothetical protein
MDSYIVRVYRRSKGTSGEEVAGLVEEVGTEQRRPFQTVTGLVTTIRQLIGRDAPGQSNVRELHLESAGVEAKPEDQVWIVK